MGNYSINVQIPNESNKRDATYYDELQQKLGQRVWIEQVRFLHQEHCAEVEFALASLRTNIVIKIDTHQSGLRVSEIVSQAYARLTSTVNAICGSLLVRSSRHFCSLLIWIWNDKQRRNGLGPTVG